MRCVKDRSAVAGGVRSRMRPVEAGALVASKAVPRRTTRRGGVARFIVTGEGEMRVAAPGAEGFGVYSRFPISPNLSNEKTTDRFLVSLLLLSSFAVVNVHLIVDPLITSSQKVALLKTCHLFNYCYSKDFRDMH